MSAQIKINRDRLLYVDGGRRLELPVEWLIAGKTEDHPVDVEILVGDRKHEWTEPLGEPIPDEVWERILDEIAQYYSQGPQADIIGPHGALLRGVSRFKFYLNLYPRPSRYFEHGYSLEIPMVDTDPDTGPEFMMDVSNIHRWTSPPEPLPPGKLDEIVARAVKENPHIVVRR